MKGTGKENEEVNGDGKWQVFGEAVLSVRDFNVFTAEAVITETFSHCFPIIEYAQNMLSHPRIPTVALGSVDLTADYGLRGPGVDRVPCSLCLYIGLEREFWETV